MKKYIYLFSIFILSLSLYSCANAVIDNTFPCPKPESSIKSEIAKIMQEEGLLLESNMANISNLIQYKSSDKTLALSTRNYHITWRLNIDTTNQIIIATPSLFLGAGYMFMAGNQPEQIVVLGDDTHDSYTEYWNVRSKLEDFCGSKVIIRKQSDMKDKKSLKEKSLNKK